MRLKASVQLSLGAAVGLVSGCGGDGGGGTAPMVYRVESTTTALAVGQDSSVNVSATVRNVSQDRLLDEAPVQYRSADYTMAIVNNSGRVTGLRGGETEILAVFRDDTLRIPLSVRANPVEPSTLHIQYSPPSAAAIAAGTTLSADRRTITLGSAVGFTLVGGQTADVAAYAEDQAGATDTNRVVVCLRCSQITGVHDTLQYNPTTQRRGIWTSTNTAVATVSNTSNSFGRVTAQGIGTAQIIFTLPGDEVADTLTVNVVQRRLMSVIIQIASAADPRTPVPNAPLAIARGGQVQLLALPRVSSPSATANNRRVTWSMESDNATVDALGTVTACSVVNPQLGCARLAVVGDTVRVRATAVPIAGDPTTVFGQIKLVVVPVNPTP